MIAPIIGWGRPLPTRPHASAPRILLPLCAIVGRPPGSFLTACNGRFASSDAWEFYTSLNNIPGDRLCGACAEYALAHHRAEATPFLISRCEDARPRGAKK